MNIKYKRILIKLSGESLSDGSSAITISESMRIVSEISSLLQHKIQIAIVIGGGNILRGKSAEFDNKIERQTSDSMGMLATVMNALALRDLFEDNGKECIVMSAKRIDGVVQSVDTHKANKLLNNGSIVIFAGGTGNPFCTTDSAASLRAIEIKADAILKASTVDGIYDKDPNLFDNAIKYQTLSFDEALQKELQVMDFNSFIQCRDFNIPICVFNVRKKDIFNSVIIEENEGSWVKHLGDIT